MVRRWSGVLLLLCLIGVVRPACADDEPTFTVVNRGQTRTWRSSELLAHPAIATVDSDAADEAYGRSMRYRAVPLDALLGEGAPDDEAQFFALDGYAPTVPVRRLKGVGRARAYLAVEPAGAPWPAMGPGKPSAGPFYVVWSAGGEGGISPSEWPYQLAMVRLAPAAAARFPKMVPDDAASADVWAGFALYGKECFPCHSINGQGEGKLGPDLNVPMNPTEYFTERGLRALVRNPREVRDWGTIRMPGFDAGRLPEVELDRILAYLRHMSGRKAPAGR
jgi:mono/diheme cytochrome c family protein